MPYAQVAAADLIESATTKAPVSHAVILERSPRRRHVRVMERESSHTSICEV